MAARLLLSVSAVAIFASLPLQAAAAREAGATPVADQSQPAPAQDAAPVPQSTPDANSPNGAAVPPASPDQQGGLAEIVVTAQHVTESSRRSSSDSIFIVSRFL